MIGQVLSHFKILEKIGGGGMGVVYKAIDITLDRTVALKFLPDYLSFNDELKSRFVTEAKTASSLQHNNICTIHSIEETDTGQLFICMDYYEGETLNSKIGKGTISFEEIIDITFQIAKGLSAAHRNKIIHRDVKPANILITNDGSVKILDFGLARSVNRTQITQVGSTMGTAAYMSPEQARGEEVDERTDVWSLGVLVYEMISGKLPFSGDYQNVIIYNILNEEFKDINDLRENIPKSLRMLVNKALLKEPELRYKNCSEVLEELNDSGDILKNNSAKRSFFSRIAIYILAIAAFLFAVVLVVLQLNNDGVELGEDKKLSIAIVSAENLSNDLSIKYLERVIPNLLITSLEQFKLFDVLTWQRLLILNKENSEMKDYVSSEEGFNICRNEGIDILILPSYIRVGNQLLTDVKLMNVENNKLIESANTKGLGIETVFSQIDYLGSKIITGLFPDEKKEEINKIKISDRTTNSIEAYNYYLLGLEQLSRINWNIAKEMFEKSITFDSTFAIAYANLAVSNIYLNLTEERDRAFEKAKLYSLNTTRKERLTIEAYLASGYDNNIPKFVKIMEQLVKEYPNEITFHNNLGWAYNYLHQPEASIEQYKTVLKLNPESSYALNALAYHSIEKGKFDAAKKYITKYIELYPYDGNGYDTFGDYYFSMGELDSALSYYSTVTQIDAKMGIQVKEAYICAIKHDFESAIEYLDNMISHDISEGNKAIALTWKSFYYFCIGQISKALSLLNSSIEIDKSNANVNREVSKLFIKVWYNYELGKIKEAAKIITEIEKIINSNDGGSNKSFIYEIKIIKAYYNFSQEKFSKAAEEIREIKNDLESEDWAIKMRFIKKVENLESAILMENNKIRELIDMKLTPVKHNFRFDGNAIRIILPFKTDYKAHAYCIKGDTASSINEYRKLLYPNELVEKQWISNPIYHFNLAKLLDLYNDKIGSVKEYRKFLEIFSRSEFRKKELIEAEQAVKRLEKK